MLSLLLFVLQPLLHAHPLGALPEDHRPGLHAPGADFAKAAVSDTHPVPDPVVVAEANRLDEPALPPTVVGLHRPEEGVASLSVVPVSVVAPRSPPRTTSPRGPPR